MQQQSIRTHQFENGLMLIVEEMPGLQSAAFSFLVPAGSIYDGAGKNGSPIGLPAEPALATVAN